MKAEWEGAFLPLCTYVVLIVPLLLLGRLHWGMLVVFCCFGEIVFSLSLE